MFYVVNMGRSDTLDAPIRFRVEGDSMSPTLEDGQYVLLMPPLFHRSRLRRGDVVVFRQLVPPWDWIVKRVVGMPDESVLLENGRLYADDLLLIPNSVPAGPDGRVKGNWWNGPDEYFVLGDNPANSTDSRTFGPVPADRILGRAWLRCWPPKAWSWVR